MKRALPMLAIVVFATGTAFADDKKTGFDALDKNNDGVLTRAEAAGNPRLLKGFDVADKNNDGTLSRAEYLAATAKRKVRDVVNKPSDPDPGFNALDKNDDGYISRAEAKGNPFLEKRFKSADSNHDGKLNRAEYVAVMAKKDLSTAKAKTEHAIDKPAGAGTSR
jgi:Ca2+-binding EF-hand superfamily protein